MVDGSAARRLSDQAIEEWQTNALTIKAGISASRLWHEVLAAHERAVLGGDLEAAWRYYGTAGMWMKLRGVSAERAVVDVAFELGHLDERKRRWLLRELGEWHDDPEEMLRMAVATGALVLVDGEREVYWQGEPITIDWKLRDVLWNYFWELCRHAKADKGIDHMTFPASNDTAVVTKQKSRLNSLPGFPASLGDLITPVGRHTQKLDLPPRMIRLFQPTLAGTLRELAAGE